MCGREGERARGRWGTKQQNRANGLCYWWEQYDNCSVYATEKCKTEPAKRSIGIRRFTHKLHRKKIAVIPTALRHRIRYSLILNAVRNLLVDCWRSLFAIQFFSLLFLFHLCVLFSVLHSVFFGYTYSASYFCRHFALSRHYITMLPYQFHFARHFDEFRPRLEQNLFYFSNTVRIRSAKGKYGWCVWVCLCVCGGFDGVFCYAYTKHWAIKQMSLNNVSHTLLSGSLCFRFASRALCPVLTTKYALNATPPSSHFSIHFSTCSKNERGHTYLGTFFTFPRLDLLAFSSRLKHWCISKSFHTLNV